jgi:hypothetical protein
MFQFRAFFLKLLSFGLLCMLGFYLILSFENGNADPIHKKLVGKKHKSLILGNSKYSQAINPAILDEKLEGLGFEQLYNFAFAVDMSSYGPYYFEAIKDRLVPDGTNGLFILGVDPFSLCIAVDSNESEPTTWPDSNLPLGIHKRIPVGPHVFYLLQWYPYPFFELLIRRWRTANEILHPNGWLEIRVPMDSSNIHWRKSKILQSLKENAPVQIPSKARLNYLEQTIELLKKHGKVFLLRLPSDRDIMIYEDQMFSHFDQAMDSISIRQQVPYFNLIHLSDSLIYTDGLHAVVESGNFLTKRIGDLIRKTNLKNG